MCPIGQLDSIKNSRQDLAARIPMTSARFPIELSKGTVFCSTFTLTIGLIRAHSIQSITH